MESFEKQEQQTASERITIVTDCFVEDEKNGLDVSWSRCKSDRQREMENEIKKRSLESMNLTRSTATNV